MIFEAIRTKNEVWLARAVVFAGLVLLLGVLFAVLSGTKWLPNNLFADLYVAAMAVMIISSLFAKPSRLTSALAFSAALGTIGTFIILRIGIVPIGLPFPLTTERLEAYRSNTILLGSLPTLGGLVLGYLVPALHRYWHIIGLAAVIQFILTPFRLYIHDTILHQRPLNPPLIVGFGNWSYFAVLVLAVGASIPLARRFADESPRMLIA